MAAPESDTSTSAAPPGLERRSQRAWIRWLPLAMLAAGVIGLAALIATGSHTTNKPRPPASSEASAVVADAIARSAATGVGSRLEQCAATHGGDYSKCPLSGLLAGNQRLADNARETQLTLRATARAYLITTRSTKSQNSFTLAREPDGTVRRSCTLVGHVGCGANGTW